MSEGEGTTPNGGEEDRDILYIWNIPVDRAYATSPAGIIKCVLAIISLTAFIFGVLGMDSNCYEREESTYIFFALTSMTCFLCVVFLWFFCVLGLDRRAFWKRVKWNLVEMILLSVYGILYLIGSVRMASRTCGEGSNMAATAFGFLALVTILVHHAFWKMRDRDNTRRKERDVFSSSQHAASPRLSAARGDDVEAGTADSHHRDSDRDSQRDGEREKLRGSYFVCDSERDSDRDSQQGSEREKLRGSHRDGDSERDSDHDSDRDSEREREQESERESERESKQDNVSSPLIKEPTVSDGWRNRGNAFYRAAGVGDLLPVTRSGKLQEAINHYGRALSTAASNDERAMANKNSAMASWKMGTAQQAAGASKQNITFYYREALKFFKEAKKEGKDRDDSWHDTLDSQGAGCWSDIQDRVFQWDFEERVRGLELLVPLFHDGKGKAFGYLEIAQLYFHESLSHLADRAYMECLRLLEECNFPLNEARRLGHRDRRLRGECDVLEEDICVQRCVAQSIQARTTGEELLTYVLDGTDVLNMDMVWEVVDWFSRASQLTRDRDLEMEAMALSALGKVYDQVLKMKDRAKAYLMKTLELANSMVPRNFTGQDWYNFARKTVEGYQQEKVRVEEGEKQKEREGVMGEIKEQLDELTKKQGELSKLDFLKFVYTTHPPKHSDKKLGEVSATPETAELKKLYQKAVIHYHPDKVSVEEYGAQWKVLTEEITKLMTGAYEFYKGSS